MKIHQREGGGLIRFKDSSCGVANGGSINGNHYWQQIQCDENFVAQVYNMSSKH
jgi:hypothetical protein